MDLFNIKGPSSYKSKYIQTDKTMIDTRMQELEQEYIAMWEQNKVLKEEK